MQSPRGMRDLRKLDVAPFPELLLILCMIGCLQ